MVDKNISNITETSRKMIPLRKTWAAAATVAILSIGGIASAAIPPSDTPAPQLAASSTAPAAGTIVVAQNEDPTKGHHYSKEEFDRQSAVLAPDENDHTRLFVFGGLGVVLAGLLGFVVVNRKKWGGGPTA